MNLVKSKFVFGSEVWDLLWWDLMWDLLSLDLWWDLLWWDLDGGTSVT